MKKYKIVFGYNEGDYLPINGNELHKAIALFMEGNGKALFESGAIRGQDIIRIVPDWHAVKGWNRGWKMTTEDYDSIKSLEADYREAYNRAKYIAEIAIRDNKRELLSLSAKDAYSKLPQLTSSKILLIQ